MVINLTAISTANQENTIAVLKIISYWFKDYSAWVLLAYFGDWCVFFYIIWLLLQFSNQNDFIVIV